jgi:drug/metabolite transporter (DMT)-like permease
MSDDTPQADPHAVEAWKLHGALLAVQLLFSGFHVAGKWVMGEIHPFALAAMRVGFVTPVLLALAWQHDYAVTDRRLPRGRDLLYLAMLGGFGVFGNQVLFLWGLSYTTATNAAVFLPSVPVFAAAIGALLGIDRIGPRRLAGIALAVAGALVVLDTTHFDLADDATVGNLLVLANCCLFAAFLVLQRPLLRRLPWRTVIAGSFAFGSIGVFAVGGRELAAIDYAAVPNGTWVAVAYALLATLIAYMINSWAVQRSSPTLVAAYTTVQPVTSALLASWFLAETIGWKQAVGFVLIAGGLWVVSKRQAAVRNR